MTNNHILFNKSNSLVLLASIVITGCSSVNRDALTYDDASSVEVLNASVETEAVKSSGDAADDPAIWINNADLGNSLIIGTDKQSGLGVYNLKGELVQFLKIGRPNNVDVRQQVNLDGEYIDIAAFSNRFDDTIGWLEVDESGIRLINSFSSAPEPYGFCLGLSDNRVLAFVTYKSGLVEQYHYQKDAMTLTASFKLATQLEGCVYDDLSQQIFIGEEGHGIWRFNAPLGEIKSPFEIDRVESESGIVADVEGLSIYQSDSKAYLVASSQGNDSYALYEAEAPHNFVKRIRVVASENVDGAQETDGLDTTGISLPGFPDGLLVVQDGFNDDGKQNFKLINASF